MTCYVLDILYCLPLEVFDTQPGNVVISGITQVTFSAIAYCTTSVCSSVYLQNAFLLTFVVNFRFAILYPPIGSSQLAQTGSLTTASSIRQWWNYSKVQPTVAQCGPGARNCLRGGMSKYIFDLIGSFTHYILDPFRQCFPKTTTPPANKMDKPSLYESLAANFATMDCTAGNADMDCEDWFAGRAAVW